MVLEDIAESEAVDWSARDWLRVASEGSVMRRAIGFAAIVGALLIAINHGDALLRGDVGVPRLFKMGLTMLVPYAVSTFSSVASIRAFRKKT